MAIGDLIDALQHMGDALNIKLAPIRIILVSRNCLVRNIDRNLTFYIKEGLCLNRRRNGSIDYNLLQFSTKRESIIADRLYRSR